MPHPSNRGTPSIATSISPTAPDRRELEALLANLPGMAYRCCNDARCSVLFVSDGCRELLGFEPAQFFGDAAVNYDELVHPEERAAVRGRIEAALAEQRGFELRYRIRTATGQEKWVSDRGRGVYGPDGGLETIEGFVSDITELKRAEATLREHDNMLTLAFSNARDMMLLARVEPGLEFRVQSVNQRYIEVVNSAGFGLTAEQIVGRTFSELRTAFGFSDATWELLISRYHAVVAKKQPLNYAEVTETPSGLFHGRSTISPVCDEAGECRFVLYASADVTDQMRAEEALRESEEKFAKAFRASPGAMAITEPDGRGFVEVNDGYTRIFGYSREEFIGATALSLGLWADLRQRERFHELLRTEGRVWEMEVDSRAKCGTPVVCLMSAESLQLGGRRCLVIALYDITDRKRAEAARRESEEKFSKAFRAVPDAVFITEVESGRVVDVNEGSLRLFGYVREECIGRTTFELNLWHNPGDRARMLEQLQANGGAIRDLEIPCQRRDGTRVDVVVSCETIELEGRPHLVTIAHDITARKRAEVALRESEAKFAKAFHASPGGMAISEFESKRFVEVSDGYARIFGYTRQEMLGRTGVELQLWAREEERLKFLSDTISHGSVRNMEVEGRRRDGAPVFCLLSAELMELDGRAHGITALYDITERRRAEQQRVSLEAQLRQTQKLDSLGRLAGGIAHDFNNILTGIGAYTELAVMDAERPVEMRKHLAQVRRATDRAAELVRQILTFSRQTPQERKPTQLAIVVHEALKLLRSSIPKTVELSERLDERSPVVLADATQIHQVIMNLCTNAAHAMRERAGRLTVTLDALFVPCATPRERSDLEPGHYARLVVRDTGHGMDAATLARIFEPFFTTKSPGEGTGLGLSVVHGIVEEHDGTISACSEVGVGTTVEICLPEHGAIVPQDVETNSELPRGRGERILLVDDEAAISAAAAELLRRIGYRVWPHTDPQTALTMFDAAPTAFDAVLTDLAMPRITGIEVARRVLEKRADMPVLLASGHSGAWTPENLRALGVRRLISKPLTASKLARALRSVLDAEAP